jgi:hypothetical protein
MNRNNDIDRASEHLDRAGDQTSDAVRHLERAGHEVKEALEAGASGTLERTRETAREVGRQAEHAADRAADAARDLGNKAGHVAERVAHAQPDRGLERSAGKGTEKVLDRTGQAVSGAAPVIGRGAEAAVAATGAALHAVGGLLGTVVGKIAGRVGGWWNTASEAIAELPEAEEQACRAHFDAYQTLPAGVTWDTARTAYLLGYIAAENPAYRERSFDEVEVDLQHGFDEGGEELTALRDFTRFGYERALVIRPSQDQDRVTIR